MEQAVPVARIRRELPQGESWRSALRMGRCRNVDIARHLGVSRASVSKALVKLSEAGLVEVVDHDVGFTSEGRAIAEATSARHRFFEGRCATPGSTPTKHPEMPPAGGTVSPPIFREALFPLDEESSLRVKRRLSAPGAASLALLLGRSESEISPHA